MQVTLLKIVVSSVGVGFLWFFLLLTDEKKEGQFIKRSLIPGGVVEGSLPSRNDKGIS